MIKKILEKYNKTPVAARASFWFVICSVLQKGIAFITTPIFTRLMSTEQYGQFTIYNSWVEIFFVFATLDVFYGVYNNALTKYSYDRERITSSMLGFCTTLTIFVFVVYFSFRDSINSLTGMSTNITIFLFVEILFMPAFYFWSAKERYEYRYQRLIIVTLSMTLLSPLLGVPAVIYSTERGYARIITSVLAQVLIAVILYFDIFRKGKLFFNKTYWKYALKFNLPLIPHYLSSMVLNQSDRLMIDRMCGADKAGIYGLAYTLGTIVIMFNNAIMNSFTPYTYQNLKKQNYKTVEKTTNYLVIIVATLSMFIVLISPEIMLLIGGNKYMDGVYIVAPIAISIYFRFLYGLYANIEFYFEENYFIMIASVLCAALNIVTNYIFIKMFGYLAAGYTTLGCFAVYAFAHYAFSKKVLRKHTEKNNLYNDKLILLVGGVLILLSVSIIPLYFHYVIRYSIIVLLVLIILLKKRKIIEVLSLLKTK